MSRHFRLAFCTKKKKNHSIIEIQTYNCTIIRAEWYHCRIYRMYSYVFPFIFSVDFLAYLFARFFFVSFNRFGNVDHQNMFTVNMRYQFIFLVVQFFSSIFFCPYIHTRFIRSHCFFFCSPLSSHMKWHLWSMHHTHLVVCSFIAHIANQPHLVIVYALLNELLFH